MVAITIWYYRHCIVPFLNVSTLQMARKFRLNMTAVVMAALVLVAASMAYYRYSDTEHFNNSNPGIWIAVVVGVLFGLMLIGFGFQYYQMNKAPQMGLNLPSNV